MKLLGKYGTAVQLNIDWKMREEETRRREGEIDHRLYAFARNNSWAREDIFNRRVRPREIKGDFTKQKFSSCPRGQFPWNGKYGDPLYRRVAKNIYEELKLFPSPPVRV